MDLLSDISSVSSHGSMPPLIDQFGRIILDDDQETISIMEPELNRPSSVVDWTYEAGYEAGYESREYDETDLQFYRPPPIEIPQNTHLYFDDDGEEICREQYLMKMDLEQQQQQQEEEQEQQQEEEQEQQQEEEQEQQQEQPPQEEEEAFSIRTPLISHKFTMRHPRVILDFLRFIDTYNEVAEADEIFMLPAIPKKVYDCILTHVSFTHTTPPEFESEVNELKLRLERHMDLSELPVN
jgi:type II secretory pathway pseudopilin PulG